MVKLERFNMVIKSAMLGEDCPLPAISGMFNLQQRLKPNLGEDDGVFLGYGFLEGSFPYPQQHLYNRELSETEIETYVLENNFLKATFIPSLGGRLWSLIDKTSGRELTYCNRVLRYGNLSFRNAWFSGGIEWNFGVVGHHPFTCAPVFTSRLSMPDGTPVLRIYEYERIRCCTFQVDFFLPENSSVLFCRTRIVNPNSKTVPVYWWSNVAVPENEKARTIVAAEDCFDSKNSVVSVSPVPIGKDNFDVTYPLNNPYAIDYFWRVRDGRRKYIAQLDKDGYGLFQTSTSKLRGRKLFVWGNSQGGDKWQEFLSGDGDLGRYSEIQMGLAQTQYECVPMPPESAWEWLEAYGAMHADGDEIHGEWSSAQQEVEKRLDGIISQQELEKILADTKDTVALKPAQEILVRGSGWGALENMRRKAAKEKPLPDYLDFGNPGEDQKDWQHLLEKGCLPQRSASSERFHYMMQPEWTQLLKASMDSAGRYNWYAWYQLGLIYFVEKDLERAQQAFDKSLKLCRNSWALYGMAQLCAYQNQYKKAAVYVTAAWDASTKNLSFAKECYGTLLKSGEYGTIINMYSEFTEEIKNNGRILLGYAMANLRLGNFEMAEEILYRNGGLVVPDIREGELIMTELWSGVEQYRAKKSGRVFDSATATPPKMFDFRMIAALGK